MATANKQDTATDAATSATEVSPAPAPATLEVSPDPAPAPAPEQAHAVEPASDILADFTVAPARKVQFEAGDYAGVEVPELSRGANATATVMRGRRTRDLLPVFYVQDGTAQPYCMPLSAVAAILAGDLLTVAEVRAIFARAGRLSALEVPTA